MSKTTRNSLIVFPILVLIGYGLAFAGSRGGATIGTIPLFTLAVWDHFYYSMDCLCPGVY